MDVKQRIGIAALVISAAGLGGIWVQEGFTDKAVIPVKGDRPTIGHGSTFREDGSPVQLGDTITKEQAEARSRAHIAKDEGRLRACFPDGAEMLQAEWDILVDFSYQYGVATTCKSSMVRHTIAGDYEAACRSYPLYKYGPNWYDCSTPGNRVCPGVHTRNLKRQADCLAAQ